MPILKLQPACKDYLWGGEKLRTDYHVNSDLTPLAEAWVLSCHPDGASLLENGITLPDYIKANPAALGINCGKFADFPLLIKLIDAKKALSIQVHPSDAYALEHEHQYGKTEMWVILDHKPGAFLYYGFKAPITKEEYRRRIAENTLTEVLNAVEVHKGDVFFIPSGTLHAIGAGILLAEIQQNSNVTYRVYDYGRLGADGKPRALHIEQALAVTDLAKPTRLSFGSYLGRCRYFTTDLLQGDAAGTAGAESFVSLLVTSGAGTLASEGQTVPVRQGDSVFLPANSGPYSLQGDCTVLRTTV